MTLPRTVADVLTDHVVFEIECIDRMYLNVYVPGLQFEGGVVGFVQQHLGLLPIASTAPLGKISDSFSAAMRRFARDQQVPWIDFVKGQRKDDLMHAHLAGFDREEGCCSSGVRRRRPGCSEPRSAATPPWGYRGTGRDHPRVGRPGPGHRCGSPHRSDGQSPCIPPSCPVPPI